MVINISNVDELKKSLEENIKLYNRFVIILEQNHITMEDFLSVAPFVFAYAYTDYTQKRMTDMIRNFALAIALIQDGIRKEVIMKFDDSNIKITQIDE